MSRIIHFIQYHNATTIIIAVLLLASGAMAASPEAREFLYNSEDIPRSVDNSYLLNIEIGRSDFGLVILEIEEDEQGYYIEYQYNTVKVEEYSWQPISKEGTLTVLKSSLGKQDLGELVARELGQFVDREYTYVKDAQKIERAKGPSQKVMTTKYAGLIGAFLDPEDKVFPGYEPVVKTITDKPNTTTDNSTSTVNEHSSVVDGFDNVVPGYIIEPDPITDAVPGFTIPVDLTADAEPSFILNSTTTNATSTVTSDESVVVESTILEPTASATSTTEVSSATTTDSNVENTTSTEPVVESSTTTESTVSVTSAESIEANSTTTDMGGNATSTDI